MRRTPAIVTSTVLVAAGLLTGCSGASGGDSTPSATAPSSAPSSPSASPSPTFTAFARTCDDALALTAVSQAAGQPIIGTTAFVVGEPDTTIGRLAYLNCRYGIPEAADPAVPVDPAAPPAPAYLLEIGVSRYDSADRATARVAGTVADYRSTGSAAKEVRVGSATGTVLTGTGPATLVVADGPRTVAVTADPSIVLGDQTLVAVAALALTNVT